MIFYSHGKHMDLSKIVSISDLVINTDATRMGFTIHFQLMDKPMSFSICHEGLFNTEPWIECNGFHTYLADVYTEEYRTKALSELKKFKQDYNRLLNAWIKINEISKS